jgi:hypothetical protein
MTDKKTIEITEHLHHYESEPKQRNMGGSHNSALKGLKKSGQQFEVKVSLYPFVEGQEVFALGFIMEI